MTARWTLPPARSLVLGLSGALLLGLFVGQPAPAHAADFWQRAQGRASAAERETREALFRAEAGTSDALDEHLVRVSMVDVARGKVYGEALTLVYVVRTRRLLGLSSLPGELGLLEAITASDGPVETVALAALELSRLHRLQGDLTRARVELDRALGCAWRSELRIEAYLMRGWLALEQNELGQARSDFQAVLAYDPGRSRLALALASLAQVDLLRGDVPEARRLLGRARETADGGGAVSPIQPSQRPELLPRDRRALEELAGRLSDPR